MVLALNTSDNITASYQELDPFLSLGMDWLLALGLSLLDTHTLVSLDLALRILGFFSSRQQQTRCIYRNIFMKNKLEYICRHLRHDCVRRDR